MTRITYVMPDEYPQFTDNEDYRYVQFNPEQLTFDLSKCGYDIEHIECVLAALRAKSAKIIEN